MLPFFICFQRDFAEPNLFFEDEAIEVESLEDPEPELVKDDLKVSFGDFAKYFLTKNRNQS